MTVSKIFIQFLVQTKRNFIKNQVIRFLKVSKNLKIFLKFILERQNPSLLREAFKNGVNLSPWSSQRLKLTSRLGFFIIISVLCSHNRLYKKLMLIKSKNFISKSRRWYKNLQFVVFFSRVVWFVTVTGDLHDRLCKEYVRNMQMCTPVASFPQRPALSW